MDLKQIAALDPALLRGMLPSFLAGYIGDPDAAARSVTEIAGLVAALPDSDVRRLLATLAGLGDEERLYPADPAARAVSRAWCRAILPAPSLEGAERLVAAMADGPALVVCNHLSYFDTSATDALFAWAGHEDVADRLVAVAGPKVYTDVFRRFAAMCLNTLPAPQSTQLEGTARLGPRELARRALRSVANAHEAMAQGYVPLLYPEGSRTRTGRLRPFLKAVHRYMDVEGLSVVPMALTGTERVFPVDSERLYPAEVRIVVGTPLRVSAGDARAVLEAAHGSIAALLPPERRPDPTEPPVL